MARVNITVPDELIARARAAGLNVSAAAAAGIASELVNLDKAAAFDRWVAEDGPLSDEELAAADAWIKSRAAVVVGGQRAESA